MNFLKPTKLEIGSKVSFIKDAKVPKELMRFVALQNHLKDIHKKEIREVAKNISKLFTDKEKSMLLECISSYAKNNLIFIHYITELFKQIIEIMKIPLQKEYMKYIPENVLIQMQKENFFPKDLIIEINGKENSEEWLNEQLFDYEKNSIIDILIRDDVDSLKRTFLPNELSHHYVYLKYINKMCPIIDCSAIAGAAKCFRFLLSQGETITEDTCDEILLHGTVEIA